ncbi:MAG TPA: CHAT domain-containing protein, partial [Myxococcaceae bacterium]|nr:CHAT domain-containing protein [Myxococcaceae bacterium]
MDDINQQRMRSRERQRRELRLELIRAHHADKPFEYPAGRHEYLREESGQVRRTAFTWDDEVHAALAALGRTNPDPSMVQRLGDALRVFVAPLDWRRYEEEISRAVRGGEAVEVVFRFSAAELYALPWELLTLEGTGQSLGELPGCSLRYEWPGTAVASSAAAPAGGRLLFAYSAAGGHVPAEAHVRALRDACSRGHYPLDPRRDVLANVSLGELARALAASRAPIHALHLLCHGGQRGETAGLWLNSPVPSGEPELVDGASLRRVLAPYAGQLRLVVLSACRSGDSEVGIGNHLGSVAQALHRVGIPAVVASRLPLSAEGSVRLAETLYEHLLVELSSLDQALVVARDGLRQRVGLDWAALQLYAHEGPGFRPFIFRPYRGLLAFEPRHQRFFFGREALNEKLRRRVLDAGEGKLPRFQVVAGASGCGKSSLVMAGLAPTLSPQAWELRVVRPGEHTALDEVARLQRERKLLLIVDQFEEIFTRLSAEERQGYVKELWRLARDGGSNVVVVATLRIDDLSRCGEVPVEEGLRLDAVVYDEAHRVFVSQPASAEYAEVITGPADRVGLELESGLLERLLNDVGQEPGALPLLEFALDLLWQERDGGRLTHRAYERIGGVAGALANTVEQLYQGLSSDEQRQARRLLVSLMDFREDPARHTRRRARWSKLRTEDGAERAAFDAVLEKLAAGRLLVKGGQGLDAGMSEPWIEIAHEELLRQWKRLEEWSREDRERELQLRELESWADAWLAHRTDSDGGDSYLLTGNRLGYARSLQERYPGALGRESERFVEESWQHSERRRQRELERERLTEQRLRRARNSALTLVATTVGDVDPTLAVLLLREAGSEGDPMWSQAVLDTLPRWVSQTIFRGHSAEVVTAHFSPDGESIVTASLDGTAQVWRADGRGAPVVLNGDASKVLSAGFSPDGGRVVTVSEAGTVRVWRMDGQGGRPVVLEGHAGKASSVSFSPDGTRLVLARWDGTAEVWRADGRGPPVALVGHARTVSSARFSPDGSRIVTASWDGTARVWSADGRGAPVVLKGHLKSVLSAEFNRDGSRVATASRDGTARVWSADGQGTPVVLTGHVRDVVKASFSPDGSRVMTVSWDGTVRVWRVDGKGTAWVVADQDQPVVASGFSLDGSRVITATADGTARVWRLDGRGEPMVLKGHGREVLASGFSPDGARVVTASADGTARVWRVDGHTEPRVLAGHATPVLAVTSSPDGTRVVTGSRDGEARLWRSDGHGEPLTPQGHTDAVVAAGFSSDGAHVFTASWDGTVRVWRVDGGARPVVLEGGVGKILAAQFSPDCSRIATASSDGTARVWSADGRRLPVLLKGHSKAVVAVGFSPDGTRVVTASWDGTARVWATNGRGEPLVLEGHGAKVMTAGFNVDGTRIVTASWDGTARVWRADGQGVPVVLRGHED